MVCAVQTYIVLCARLRRIRKKSKTPRSVRSAATTGDAWGNFNPTRSLLPIINQHYKAALTLQLFMTV